MNDNASQVSRYATLDVLRGLAALFVACLHVRETAWVGQVAYWHSRPKSWSVDNALALVSAPVMFGSFGVSAFFVISGYCIHRAHAVRLATNPNYLVDARQFWFRRFIRIYPVLFAALCVTLICDSISAHFAPGFYKLGDTSLTTFAINLTALVGLFSHTYGSNGALWTLAIEIQFYLVYPLVFVLLRRFGIRALLAGAFLLMGISWYLLDRRGTGLTCFTSYEFTWLLGVWVAERETRAPIPPRLGPIRRAIALGQRTRRNDATAVIAALLVLGGCAAFMVSQYLAFQIWAVGFALLLPLLLDATPRFSMGVVTQAFSRLGQFSYSLYAIHLPVAVMATCVLFRGQKPVSPVPAVLIVAGAVACAYVFSLLCEQPFVNLLARRADRARLQPPSLPLPLVQTQPQPQGVAVTASIGADAGQTGASSRIS